MFTASVVQVLFVFHGILVQGVMVLRKTEDIRSSKSQIHLQPVMIACAATDIIVISSPVVIDRKARYYLYNPKGDITKLIIDLPQYKKALSDSLVNITFANNTRILTTIDNYKVFNVNVEKSKKDPFGEWERAMEKNDFMIGPVGDDDYGNWIVSVLFKDDKGDWSEVNQVFTIDIMQEVLAATTAGTIAAGEMLRLGFAYSIPDITSCQLIAPLSSFDRFYDRDSTIELERCGFVLPNVTKADSGLWTIIGIGRITYQTEFYVSVT